MISIKTPINTTLCLCAILLLSTTLLFISHVEFLSYVYILVYVGGIALLFLFVIIMLNLKVSYNNKVNRFGLLSGPTILFLLSIKLQSFLMLFFDNHMYRNSDVVRIKTVLDIENSLKLMYLSANDINSLGLLLYTHYFFNFLLSGVILLTTMLGVLVISLNSNKD